MNEAAPRPKRTFLRRLRRLFWICFIPYLVICGIIALQQRQLIYHPHLLTSEQVDAAAAGARLERWTNSAGQAIGFQRPSPKQPAEASVMVMYGNGSTAIGSGHYADQIQSIAAFDFFILEYPGYEDRPGSPSQESLFNAASEAFQMLPTDKPVYLAGESLGTGVASYLAGTYSNRIAGVILISPFNSMTDVAQHHYRLLPVWLLLADRFPSEKYLRKYHGRLGITVDGQDSVVPERFGLGLYRNYTGPKKLWEFPDGEHCQIMEEPSKFWKEVIDFWQANRA